MDLQRVVQMPPFDSFRDAESYCATLAHECTHWTRHSKRLDRDFGRKRVGDEGYAIEELVAELASAFLSADLDLTPSLHDDRRPVQALEALKKVRGCSYRKVTKAWGVYLRFLDHAL